jgi:hypothetical protein
MNFPNFPLYESLKNSECKELTEEDKTMIVEKIKHMSTEKQEIVYALIKAFYLEKQNQISSNELPYGGKELKNRLKFDLECIPTELQNILKMFCLIK